MTDEELLGTMSLNLSEVAVRLTKRRCRTCKFYTPLEQKPHMGECSRWRQGYGQDDPPNNEVIVENDEGWGAMMGPFFGCVLHEPRP